MLPFASESAVVGYSVKVMDHADWNRTRGVESGNERRVRVLDLVAAGLLPAGEALTWPRPRIGEEHRAVVTRKGRLRLGDGREFSSPSTAAAEAANVRAVDGWLAWRIGGRAGPLLNELRVQYKNQQRQPAQ